MENKAGLSNLDVIVSVRGSATLRALFRACAESLASENTSRLAAMERADKNIDELLEGLHGTFHRLRQSSIDEELFDVISSYELLAKETVSQHHWRPHEGNATTA